MRFKLVRIKFVDHQIALGKIWQISIVGYFDSKILIDVSNQSINSLVVGFEINGNAESFYMRICLMQQ